MNDCLLWIQLDKASIIKDAIDYVQQLQEQERTVLAELSQLESLREKKASLGELEFDDLPFLQRKKKRTAPGSPSSSPIEVVERMKTEPPGHDYAFAAGISIQ
ncbi:hypothetical protein OPV22_016908 [Ensete ventricosum]|uniref:BHLH domain-containing protein n=1 Tax=Ensete ventricosum TaxID=4639 RepID=A0AAV8QW15_ENSVE|nr:hypothetical protein OPV22_016908 [Ensete ventricosum]